MKHSSSKRIRDERSENVTTAPLTATVGNDIEFTDSPGAYRIFSLKRTYLYLLEKEGLIKGCSLRKKGRSRGKKLWSVASIRSYLESQMTNGGDA